MKPFLFSILIFSSIYAQGYIDQDSVMRSFPEYILAQREINQRQKELTDTFEMMMKEYENITYHHPGIPESIRTDTAMQRLYTKQLEEDINKAQSAIDAYSYYAMNVMGDLENEWRDLMLLKLKTKTELFCQKYQITSMVDNLSLLYCPNCKDYTHELILFIQKE